MRRCKSKKDICNIDCFHKMNSITPFHNTRFIVVSIIVFTAFLFLFNIGKRDLWAPDEPRYAQVSKEMRDSGNFIVPHLNSKPYPDKPPLLFWLINVFSLPFEKITALSSRLPSAFAGIGCCVALFYLATSLYRNTRIALMASLILATSSKFLWMTHRVAFDVLLTLLVTLSILFFYKGYTEQKNKGLYYTVFYVLMAFGVLAKGPIGFILPFLIVLTYLILKRDVGILKDTKPWIGGILFTIIVFTWVYLAGIYGGKEYTNQILFKQNVGRFASSFAHKRPFYYYFINFPVNFLPWSIFIPSIVMYLFSQKGREKIPNILTIRNFKTKILRRSSLQNNNICHSGRNEESLLLPIVWFAVVFIFFSIVSGKRDIYVLPLYPAAALFIAWFLNEFIEQSQENYFRKTGYYPCYILCGISLVLGVLFPITVYKAFPQYITTTTPFTIILSIAGIVMLYLIKHARIIPFFFTLVFVICIIFNVSTVRVIPILDHYKSAKEICGKAKAMMKPDDRLAMYNFFRDPYLFYTDRNSIEVIAESDNLRKFLNSQERVFLFIQEKDFKKISKLPEMPLFVLERDSVGHREIFFVSNKDS